MRKGISIFTYRFIDLFIFTALTVIFGFVSTVGTKINSASIYSISLFIPIMLIVMMRWGLWSIIVAIAGSVTYCYANNGVIDNYIIYIIGDLFIFINLFWFIKGKSNIKEKTHMSILYAISGYFLVEIGRSVVSLILGYGFIDILIGFLGTDSLSALIGLVIVLIARKQNGLFEDQITYLKRISEEELKKKNLNES